MVWLHIYFRDQAGDYKELTGTWCYEGNETSTVAYLQKCFGLTSKIMALDNTGHAFQVTHAFCPDTPMLAVVNEAE